jgi:hypothetical protein
MGTLALPILHPFLHRSGLMFGDAVIPPTTRFLYKTMLHNNVEMIFAILSLLTRSFLVDVSEIFKILFCHAGTLEVARHQHKRSNLDTANLRLTWEAIIQERREVNAM